MTQDDDDDDGAGAPEGAAYNLTALGWSGHFAAHWATGDPGQPVRVSSVHRSRIAYMSEAGPGEVPADARDVAVGDWIIVDEGRMDRVLPRLTELKRRAAGEVGMAQLVAANVDTLGIVTSCNADFNVARLERYLALAAQGGCLPLIILTKADQCDDPEGYRREAERISPLVTALAVNAKDADEAARLAPWCREGQTLALVGMSGVGKTTLQNHLTWEEDRTGAIREDDARGRHTTTSRVMRATKWGGWLIDTPGMRELGLAEAGEGIAQVFADIAELAEGCRFRDCAHESEPGCAVLAAIERGEVEADRVARWRKLLREDQINAESVREARARQKAQQKVYNSGAQRGRHKRR